MADQSPNPNFKVDRSGVEAPIVRGPDSARFILRVDNVRRERTGDHGRVSVLDANRYPIAYDVINLGRAEQRNKLARLVHGRFSNGLREQYPLEGEKGLMMDLDDFCSVVWDQWVQRYRAILHRGEEKVDPPSFALWPFIIDEGGTIIYGPPGRGKSYIALLMAVTMDAGITQLWRVQKRRVLFINLERSRTSLTRRISIVNRALALPATRGILTVNARGRKLTDMMDAIQEDVREHEIDVVFLDSLSRSGFGKMTEDDAANAAMDALNQLSPTWVALGHTPRSDDKHVFGSQMYDAAIDVGVQLSSVHNQRTGALGIGLTVTKTNDFAPPQPARLTLEFSELGLSSVRPASTGEFPELEAQKSPRVIEEIEDYLHEFGKGTATQISQAIGRPRSDVSRWLRTSRFVKLPREGRSVPYAVAPRRGEAEAPPDEGQQPLPAESA